jgi:hypothetical protein
VGFEKIVCCISTGKTEKENWMEGIRKAMKERNLNEG